jgi:flavin reductase (DIM6/NTAB) family NADH-FMN oxidoreductase RutF
MPVDTNAFRRALANMPTPVTVVTTVGTDGRPYGFTASSVCSLSLDPPLLLVCIGKHTGCYRAFRTAERFAVNVLADHQEELARQFATRGADKFNHAAVTYDGRGLPHICGALTRLVCAPVDLLDGGDHSILVGRVEHAPVTGGRPLLYFNRDFRALDHDAVRRTTHPERASRPPGAARRPLHNRSVGRYGGDRHEADVGRADVPTSAEPVANCLRDTS